LLQLYDRHSLAPIDANAEQGAVNPPTAWNQILKPDYNILVEAGVKQFCKCLRVYLPRPLFAFAYGYMPIPGIMFHHGHQPITFDIVNKLGNRSEIKEVHFTHQTFSGSSCKIPSQQSCGALRLRTVSVDLVILGLGTRAPIESQLNEFILAVFPADFKQKQRPVIKKFHGTLSLKYPLRTFSQR
jgi:hypothetical protein